MTVLCGRVLSSTPPVSKQVGSSRIQRTHLLGGGATAAEEDSASDQALRAKSPRYSSRRI